MDTRHTFFSKSDRISYVYLLKWSITAVIAGCIGGCLVHYFTKALALSLSFIETTGAPLCILPAAGALLVGGVLYRIEGRATGEGIPSYIRSLVHHNGVMSKSVTGAKFFAALITLATLGNGGIVGPLGRVSAGILSSTIGLFIRGTFWTDDDRRTATICGMAAVVGTIFHSSIGGGIFAVEIIQKAKMGYRDLFPAILSSASAVFICNVMGWESFYRFAAVDSFMDVSLIGWLLLLAIIAGAVGGLYTKLYSSMISFFGRSKLNILIKVTVASLIAGTLAWLVNPELLGTSKSMVDAIFTANYPVLTGRFSGAAVPVGLVLLGMICIKAFCNSLTVSSGMNAGFTGPAIIIGMLLGMTLANVLNIAVGTASYHAFMAAGLAAMLASSMNIPLAAAVITIEVFGLQYSFPAGFSAVIGFQVMRHKTIYDYAVNSAPDKDSDDWR